MTKRLGFGLAAAVLSVLITLALAETLARAFYSTDAATGPAPVTMDPTPAAVRHETSGEAYDEPGVRYGHYGLWVDMVWHSYLSYAPEPSSGGLGYQTNDRGFRYDEDLTPEKAPNEIRIFVTGGSAAWGAGVRQEKTYARVLEERLAAAFPGKRIRVIIAAVSGYASTQERIRIANDILDLSPDYIMMMTGWNDAYFGYKGADLLREQDWLGYRAKLEPDPKSADTPPDPNAYTFRLGYVVARMRYLREQGSREEQQKEAEAQALPQERTLATFLHNIHLVADMRPRFGFRLVVALQPTLYATSKPLSDRERAWAAWGAETNLGYSEYNRAMYERYRVVLPEDARANAYTYLDMDPAIAGETSTLFVDHAHFGDRGHRFLGTYLAERLTPLLAADFAAAAEGPDAATVAAADRPADG